MLATQGLYVYYGGSCILNDVSIKIASGQAVCIMGRNGVGKTTLIKTIIGSLKPRQGTIHYEDANITHYAPHRRSQAGIGYVPQGRGIFPHLTVYENLQIGFEAVRRPSKQFMADSLDEIYETFPVLKNMGKRIAGTLSGGQQQQLAIGRTLVRHPKLVLLDEPTEGIQPNIVAEIEEVIVKLVKEKGISVLLIEQFLDFALSIADYCYVLDHGHIVSEGKAADLNEDIIREHLSV